MKWIIAGILFCSVNLHAQETFKDISVHDPVIIKQDSVYYIFCTGRGISCWSSVDMQNWKREKPVFENAPTWSDSIVPGFRNHIWAPDIVHYNDQYYLFYSVSAFGKNTSAIGVASNKTLHPEDASFKWIDHGIVISSVPGKSNFNAIDPNIAFYKNEPYLSFGSFWGGLMLIRMNNDLLKTADDAAIINIASRKVFKKDTILPNGAGNAIEAPFIFKKGNFYYLFTSIDYCCKGKESTYKMIVGRSQKIDGPYTDKDGKNLLRGGGTILLQGDDQWHGVGHNAVASFDGVDYLVFHGYDANDNGRSKLRIEKLKWDKEGWPFVEH